jgi:hypothetical protein
LTEEESFTLWNSAKRNGSVHFHKARGKRGGIKEGKQNTNDRYMLIAIETSYLCLDYE